MRGRYGLALAALALLLSGCAGMGTGTRKSPPLPEARAEEIRALLTKGSFLQAIGRLDALRRDNAGLNNLDSLESQAEAALAAGFNTAISDRKYNDALRLFDSARAMGTPEIAGTWTEKTLLEQIASAEGAAGDKVLELLTRLRIVGLDAPAEADFAAARVVAGELGNRAALRTLETAAKAHGYAVPDSATDPAPGFPKMIAGTVTILVNKGIKVEKGVGYPDRVIGSGFFIDRRGYILTNHHVIESEVDPKYEGYSRLFVRLWDSAAGDRIPAKVIGWDKTFDLALLKTEVTPAYIFGGSIGQTLTPGDRIFAIGSPAGLEQTLTSGIISALGRRLLQVGDSMQVDVPLNPGNSGGPLLSDTGDLIGIVFAGMQQFEGLNFAVPYTWVEKALPALYKGGQAVHSWLGMAVAETEKGIEVLYTLPDEPAAVSGIEPGDIIESVDGRAFTKIADLQDAVLSHSPPSIISAELRRGTGKYAARICLSERPDAPIELALKRDTRDNVLYPLFGIRLENVGNFLWRGDYVVKQVTKGSVADESGISPDDPLTIQDWQVDTDKGYALLQIVIKKKKAGFVESAIQIASYLETDNFI
jgi:serine protease Do